MNTPPPDTETGDTAKNVAKDVSEEPKEPKVKKKKKNVKKKSHNPNSKNEPHRIHLRHRTAMVEFLKQGLEPILLPNKKEIKLPGHTSETRQCLLNALACCVPIEGAMRIFREWVRLLFTAFFFKGGELCAIVKTRPGSDENPGKYHMVSHLLHETIHLGNKARLEFAGTRESVWKSLQVFVTEGDVLLNRGVLLTEIIPQLLRSVVPESLRSLYSARAFLMNRSGMLYQMIRPETTSFDHNALCGVPPELKMIFCGRRIYKHSGCPRLCPCRWDLLRLNSSEAVDPAVLHHLIPSSIDRTMKLVFVALENRMRLFPAELFVPDTCLDLALY